MWQIHYLMHSQKIDSIPVLFSDYLVFWMSQIKGKKKAIWPFEARFLNPI